MTSVFLLRVQGQALNAQCRAFMDRTPYSPFPRKPMPAFPQYDEQPDQSERDELAFASRARRDYQARLIAHPNPQDPDHPGDREGSEE